MALVTETPTNPTIYQNAGTVTAGLASDLRAKVNGYAGTVEDKAQLTQAFMEQLCAALGNGAIGGGAISAGVGLNVVITASTAIVGNYSRTDAPGTVGLTDAATNYIWRRQDGTYTANTTGAIPGTSDNHGTALLWGSAVCAAGAVSSVDNSRAYLNPANDYATATSIAAAGTVNASKGRVTTEALTTAAGADYTFSLINNRISASSILNLSLDNGTNTTAPVLPHQVTCAAGSATVKIRNGHASSALNGTLKIGFVVH
jgi:hypothetical protein